MIFCLYGTILASQIFVLWYYLGLSYIFLAIFGTVSGVLIGLIIYWLYTEITLIFQNSLRIDVAGKCVLITGCDSGFGLMLAESLAKKGMFVFAGVMNLNSAGANNLRPLSMVKLIKMDVTLDEDVKQAFEIVDRHLADTKTVLRAVVNNAGIFQAGLMEFVTVERHRQLMEVNAFGTLRVCQTFAPLLRGHGRIVNMTSVAALYVSPLVGPYCASKYAAEVISKCLRIEMYSLNLPVITISPGGYKTQILDPLYNKVYGTEEIKVYGQRFMEKCQDVLTNWLQTASKDTYEVIDAFESAILNVNFQYSYIPNFKVRIFVNLVKCFNDEFFVKYGCKGTILYIPTTID